MIDILLTGLLVCSAVVCLPSILLDFGGLFK